MRIVTEFRKRLFKAETSEADKVAAYWDTHAGEHMAHFAHWESPPPIAEAMHRYLTGNPHFPPALWFLQTYGPFASAADVGCGDGILTQGLLEHDPAIRVDAFDISAASLELGQQRVKAVPGNAERARFVRVDLNSEALPEGAYDAIFSTGAMHHVEKLDFCFASMRRALRETGVLWLNDYVGPDRFQWTDVQMRMADELLSMVPKKWRRLDHVVRCSAEDLRKLDPSEAVASSAIESSLTAHFEIERKWPRGGTLLAPIFGSGCLEPDMLNEPEGRTLLADLYNAELDLVLAERIPSSHAIYVARPLKNAESLPRQSFARQQPPPHPVGGLGIAGPLEGWIKFNTHTAFENPAFEKDVAPFPPADLMQRTSGLLEKKDFASHGADLLRALAAHVPRPLSSYARILDFGVGVGRVARMFKGYEGDYIGVDVDPDNAAWVGDNLPWVDARLTVPGQPFPDDVKDVDLVVSVSVFTHMDRESFAFYVKELARVTRPSGHAALTFSGHKVIDRALADEAILAMLALEADVLHEAAEAVASEGFYFAEQYTHLTQSDYRYGLTFVSQAFVAQAFAPYFDVETYVPGAIHDFQDLIILRRR